MTNSDCHGNWKKKALKIFLVNTVRARAFIYGMLHYLLALYQNALNHGPGVKIGSMFWDLKFHVQIKKEIFKNLLVPTEGAGTFIYGM